MIRSNNNQETFGTIYEISNKFGDLVYVVKNIVQAGERVGRKRAFHTCVEAVEYAPNYTSKEIPINRMEFKGDIQAAHDLAVMLDHSLSGVSDMSFEDLKGYYKL